MTEVHTQQVGKRWFKLIAFDDPRKNPIAEVEASYSNNIGEFFPNNPPGQRFGLPFKEWTITGLGSRKYRQQIIDHLEGKYFNGDSETN